MPRTSTTTQTTFTRPGSVTYTLYTPPSPSPSLPSSSPITGRNNNSLHATTITLPPGSTWTSGLHWHESHTEYLQIVHGTARITLSGATGVFTPADGIVVVPRFARHEWCRADVEAGGGGAGGAGGGSLRGMEEGFGKDLVVREWTDPVDGEKEVFFRNLNGVILDAAAAPTSPLPPLLSEFWLTLQLFVIFAGLDNYPVVYSGPRLLRFVASTVEWTVTHVLLFLATWVGSFLGLRAVYKEYTPRKLWEDYGVKRGLGGDKRRIA